MEPGADPEKGHGATPPPHAPEPPRRWTERLSQALSLLAKAPAFLAITIVSLLIIGAVLDARQDHALVITPLSVPADFPDKGLTGAVLANRLYDRLSELQRATISDRAPDRLESASSDEIKVEIPGTHMSFDDLNRFLHRELGHRAEVSGEVYRSGKSLVLEARVGGWATPARTASEQDLDVAMAALADDIFFATAPYRYAEYLDQMGCHAEAKVLAGRLATRGSTDDQAWSYALWSNLLYEDGDFDTAREKAGLAIERNPHLEFAYQRLAIVDFIAGHDQPAMEALQKQVQSFHDGSRKAWSEEAQDSVLIAQAEAAGLAGNPVQSVGFYRTLRERARSREDLTFLALPLATQLALAHEPGHARSVLASVRDRAPRDFLWFDKWHEPFPLPDLTQAAVLEDWPLLEVLAKRYEAAMKLEDPAFYGAYDMAFVRPWLAVAQANQAQTNPAAGAAARAWLAQPYDEACYGCRIARGRVLEALGDLPGAEAEFRALAASSPKLPFGAYHLARVLLKRGRMAEALTAAQAAGKVQPSWAEPYELAGEIALARRDPAAALKQLNAAAARAPAWSRVQDLRARALAATGDAKGAAAATAAASQLRAEEQAARQALAANMPPVDQYTFEPGDGDDAEAVADPCNLAADRVRQR